MLRLKKPKYIPKEAFPMTEIAEKKKRFTKKEWSWIMYDWANSVYATNIMAAIFPTIFVAIAGDAGDIWWGYATSIATFIVALLAPFLGAAADFKGMKKKLFNAFLVAGVVFTTVIALTNNWRIMLIGYVISRIGFAGSNLFYDSFLTDVTDNERMDKVSSWGYAMGYIGGSTIPFVISIAMLLLFGYGSVFAQKFSVVITSVWWLIFSIPFVKNVHQEHYVEPVEGSFFKATLKNTWHTAKEIFKRKGLFLFIVAYFFYIDGVGTIINISTAYGSALGLGSVGMILALLITQIVAMPCSIVFPRIARKVTARKALMGAIVVYTCICVVGFYMGFSLEPHQESYQAALETTYTQPLSDVDSEVAVTLMTDSKAILAEKDAATSLDKLYQNLSDEQKADPQVIRVMDANAAFLADNADTLTGYQNALSVSTFLFWTMATLVGTVQGGIQAVSRSYFGKMVPKERSNEFFGFFDIFGKFASVLGPFLYSLIGGWTGRSSYGVLCLIVLFIIGFSILLFGKKQMETEN